MEPLQLPLMRGAGLKAGSSHERKLGGLHPEHAFLEINYRNLKSDDAAYTNGCLQVVGTHWCMWEPLRWSFDSLFPGTRAQKCTPLN